MLPEGWVDVEKASTDLSCGVEEDPPAVVPAALSPVARIWSVAVRRGRRRAAARGRSLGATALVQRRSAVARDQDGERLGNCDLVFEMGERLGLSEENKFLFLGRTALSFLPLGLSPTPLFWSLPPFPQA